MWPLFLLLAYSFLISKFNILLFLSLLSFDAFPAFDVIYFAIKFYFLSQRTKWKQWECKILFRNIFKTFIDININYLDQLNFVKYILSFSHMASKTPLCTVLLCFFLLILRSSPRLSSLCGNIDKGAFLLSPISSQMFSSSRNVLNSEQMVSFSRFFLHEWWCMICGKSLKHFFVAKDPLHSTLAPK